MTRLHYPREFRQQSPVVSVKIKKIKNKCANPKNTSQFDHVAMKLSTKFLQPNRPRGEKKPRSQSRPCFVPDSQAMGESTIYTLLGLLARLAANGEYRAQAVESVSFYWLHFIQERFGSVPGVKKSDSRRAEDGPDGDSTRVFFSRFRERRGENGGSLLSLGFESDKHRRAVCVCVRA